MRPSWDETFLAMASCIAKRTTCKRAIDIYGGVGAVLVDPFRGNRVLGVGYCGSLPGQPHCIDVGCQLDPLSGGCQRTVHAEMNALLFSRPSDSVKTLYTTVSPCLKCLQHAIVWGVTRVVYAQGYRMQDAERQLCADCSVSWEDFSLMLTVKP